MRVASFQIEEKVQPTVTCGMSPGPPPSSTCHSAKRQCKQAQCQPVRGLCEVQPLCFGQAVGSDVPPVPETPISGPPSRPVAQDDFIHVLLPHLSRSRAAFLSLDICAANEIEPNLVSERFPLTYPKLALDITTSSLKGGPTDAPRRE